HALAACVAPAASAPTAVRSHAGAGVEGRFDATPASAGSPSWMDARGFAWDAGVDARRRELAADGATLVAYAEDGRVRALGAGTPRLRPGADAAVAELRDAGLRVEILSGDHDAAAARAGRDVGAPARGGLSPGDKVRRIEEIRASGDRVLMAGDGVNDAP